MKKLKKLTNKIIGNIWTFFDKKIVIPFTKLIMFTSSKFDKSGKKFEGWLSKTNTILFISLFLAVTVFIVVDQKIIVFTESSAEVLKNQKITAIYNEEAYVIDGLPETVDITLIGNKADLYFAKQSPTREITVDLSDLKPGTHKVNIRYNQALPSIDYKVNPSVATVIIYPKISETMTLTTDILNQDSLDLKLVIQNVAIASDKVVIKGAEFQLNNVATVKALVDIENLVKQEVGDITLKDVPLRAYDQAGNVVDVEIVPAKLDAVITIASPSKDVPIKVIPVGDLSFGKAISSIITNVTSVTVYGDEAALADLTSIPVEISVDGLKANQQFKLELLKPTGVKSMSTNNITIDISLGDSVDVELPNVNIEWRNLDESIYRVQGATASDVAVTVILKGVAGVINQIEPTDVIAYVDLTGLGAGTHDVEVQVVGNDLKVQYVSKTIKVKLIISKK